MLFKDAQLAGIRDGTITRTYRRWQRPRVKIGGVYTLRPGVAVRVTDVHPCAAPFTAEDARAAGFADTRTLERTLGEDDAGSRLYRIDFERCEVPVDARAVLAKQDPTADEIDMLRRKLATMDRRGERPWTLQVLAMIAAEPARRAPDLAAKIGLPTDVFKTRVRRLKALGLTESLEVGYRLSARGRSCLETLATDSSR